MLVPQEGDQHLEVTIKNIIRFITIIDLISRPQKARRKVADACSKSPIHQERRIIFLFLKLHVRGGPVIFLTYDKTGASLGVVVRVCSIFLRVDLRNGTFTILQVSGRNTAYEFRMSVLSILIHLARLRTEMGRFYKSKSDRRIIGL